MLPMLGPQCKDCRRSQRRVSLVKLVGQGKIFFWGGGNTCRQTFYRGIFLGNSCPIGVVFFLCFPPLVPVRPDVPSSWLELEEEEEVHDDDEADDEGVQREGTTHRKEDKRKKGKG